VKDAGAIFIPSLKRDPPRPGSNLLVNVVIYGASMDPDEGYGAKVNEKILTIDFKKFSDYMDLLLTAQPWGLNKPYVSERTSIMDFIEWTGENGNDVIEQIKDALTESGYCETCRMNFITDKNGMTNDVTEKLATDTFVDHGYTAKQKPKENKTN
jgi:hypothetical protein